MNTSCESCSPLCSLAKALVIIGGLNWGLVGLGVFLQKDLNLVTMLVGSIPQLEAAVYLVVALGALYELVMWFKKC